MKRKSRRKKDSDSPKTPEKLNREDSNKKGQAEISKDGSRQTSRSSSRSRRSLSSFFRRSRDSRHSRARSESSDRSKSRGDSSAGAEASDISAYNPRTEPRDHLRRMTVREALAESRTRGRSPNRRAIYNLEKRIMSPGELQPDETNLNDATLSTSLPDIPDTITPKDEYGKDTSIDKTSNNKALNQPGKKRGYSGGHTVAVDSFPNTITNRNNKDNFQPLDKRKYIINKENTNSPTKGSDTIKPSTESNLTTEVDVHSRQPSRDPSPYSAFASENQQHRRDSLAKFLELREKRPPRSSSNYSIGRQSIDSTENHQRDISPNPNHLGTTKGGQAATGNEVIQPINKEVVEGSVQPIGRKSLAISPSSRFQPVKPKSNVTDDSQNKSETTAERKQSKHESPKRGKYVSPRRFTRDSRKSNSSKRSSDSKEPVRESIEAEKAQVQAEVRPMRYQRKFSSSSEKRRRKISQESNASQVEADLKSQTVEAINSNQPVVENRDKTAERLTNMYNNKIEVPKPIPAISKPNNVMDSKTQQTEDRLESDNVDINTGLKDVADRIHEAMQSVTPGNEMQFPNSDFSAIPLDSITDDAPFKLRTQSETDTNVIKSRTRSQTKSASTSRKYSSNSEVGAMNIENVDDILMQDDVFETNIDEISLKSENKMDSHINREQVADKTSGVPFSDESATRQATESDAHVEHKNETNVQNDNAGKVDVKARKESKKKKKSKSDDNVAVGKKVNIEADVIPENKKRKSKKSKKERRKSKSKSSRSMSDLHADDKPNIADIDPNKDIENTLENDKIVKIEEKTDNSAKPKNSKRKSFFRRSKRSVSRTPSIHQAIVKVGRAASLSNILDTPEMKRKPSLVKTDSLKRSHSVEDISSLKYNKIEHVGANMPDSIFHRRSAKDAIWNIQTELPKSKERKSQPKLSISAIIALRAKVGRFKKARQEKEKRERESKGESSNSNLKDTDNSAEAIDKDKEEPVQNENTEARDREVANVVFENEINVSLNKQKDELETSLIDDELDNEIASIVHEKKIHFDPYISDQPLTEEEMVKQRQRNTRLTCRRESKVRKRQKKVISCCKQLIAFLFSHIGLCSLVVAYCIAGGFIFKKLEGNKELEKKQEMQTVREDYTNKIFGLAFQNKFTKRSAKEFKEEVQFLLKQYGEKVFNETKYAGWDGKDSTNEPEQWSFPSSLLYAITVMTTIGYGHVAPKTPFGRIVTIGYAVLGIPLTLLCLTNIGDFMAKGFRMLYGKVCCGLCCVLFRPSRKRRLPDPERGLPVSEERMVVQEEEKSEELIHVPTSVCLLLMSAYVLLGTWAFCTWEDWDMVTGTYFCFITLSTIGFGDVVPGMTSDQWDMNEKLVLCALYLLLGLSLIAMCFNLVQEDVKAKCRWLGMKLGIIDKPVTAV